MCHKAQARPHGEGRDGRVLDSFVPSVPAFSLLLPGTLDLPVDGLRSRFECSPLLAALLAATSGSEAHDGDAWAWLCTALRIPRQSDWPLASIWAEAEGLPTGRDYWLLATPVVFEVGHTDVRLTDATPAVDEQDASQLLTALNAHFANDGLHFVIGRSGRWFAHQAAIVEVRMHAPHAALHGLLRDVLPHGREAAAWRRWQNEIQMLMHAAHEPRPTESGVTTNANAIWFWGGGTLPPRDTARDVRLASDDPDVVALAAHAGATRSTLASVLSAQARTSTDIAVVSDEASMDSSGPLGTMDLRHLPDIDLVLTGSTTTRVLHCRRASLWQRWRRRLSGGDIATLLRAANLGVDGET